MRNLIHLNGSKTPVLMLHGFPGEPVEDLSIEKNLDFAKELNSKGHEIYLIHYEGLGKNRDGIFTFNSSITQSLQVTEHIINQGKDFILFGHSWGGYIALIINKLHSTKVIKTILLSPFIFLPDSNRLLDIINTLCSEVPYLLKEGLTPEKLTADLIKCDENYFPDKGSYLSTVKGITILHAQDDLEVPLSSSQLISEKNPNIILKTVDTDHSFRKNRKSLLQTIGQEIV